MPGASRSGSTIMGGLFAGQTRETAARFSFLLSIPAITASGLLQLKEAWSILPADSFMPLLVATIVSGVVGYASIWFLLAYLRRNSTAIFIIYRILLGAVLLVDAPPELRIRWSTAIGVTIPFALITVLLVTLVIRARKSKVETGVAGLVGATGTTRSALAPEGTVLVHGEFWNAVSPAPLEEGTPVKVVAVEGLKLKVERAS